jgi:shikimate dehydrogenase
MSIDGSTRLAGVIGWPVERALSPAVHNAAYAAMGLNWVYLPLPVADQRQLIAVVEALRILPCVGFNVTMPHKQAMLELCDETAMFAQLAGSVNTVHCVDGHFVGYNTDGRGMLETLRLEVDWSPEEKRVVVLGAGGAAGAAVVACAVGRAAHVTVVNRDMAHAEALTARVEPSLRSTEVFAVAAGPESREAVEAADLIVNATPLGMAPGDPSPVSGEWLRAGQVVFDMVYQRPSTALLDAARQAGATALGGLGMLVCQGALAVDIWTEGAHDPAPRDVMRAAAEAALARAIEAEEER